MVGAAPWPLGGFSSSVASPDATWFILRLQTKTFYPQTGKAINGWDHGE